MKKVGHCRTWPYMMRFMAGEREKDALEAASAALGVSMSALVRQCINVGLKTVIQRNKALSKEVG